MATALCDQKVRLNAVAKRVLDGIVLKPTETLWRQPGAEQGIKGLKLIDDFVKVFSHVLNVERVSIIQEMFSDAKA